MLSYLARISEVFVACYVKTLHKLVAGGAIKSQENVTCTGENVAGLQRGAYTLCLFDDVVAHKNTLGRPTYVLLEKKIPKSGMIGGCA